MFESDFGYQMRRRLNLQILMSLLRSHQPKKRCNGLLQSKLLRKILIQPARAILRGRLFLGEKNLKTLVAANDNDPIGRIYTFEEAAEKLHVSKRSLQDIIKRHPHYAKNGRVYLFCENDIQLIWGGMRCHSSSQSEAGPSIGISVAPSEAKVFSKLLEQTTKPRLRKYASSARLDS